MCGSQILGTLFSVKPKNWSKQFLKSPFFANFHNLVSRFAKVPYLTVDLWYKRVGNPEKVP